ncbi:MAG TPA: glycoside hydrolase family 30 beta sandwich domain-containing protein [Phycisphaerae bacterium]|nr:glycoside hydrolase family 30 beta sandwich domain-containing protein [Phycisphaerae bacterium]
MLTQTNSIAPHKHHLRFVIRHLSFVISGLLLTTAASAATPQWICSTAAVPWRQMPAPQLTEDPAAKPDLLIHTQQPLQQIEGFGGCFNELGWQVLLTLSERDRTQILRDLFADEGCAFTRARMPIGASDYARDWYSLDDTPPGSPNDLSLSHFNIERDRGYMLHYVKAAMTIRPDLQIWLSAWSPPAWMKDNNNYASGHLKSDPVIQKAYAQYLAKAVQAYQSEGLHIYACMVQNEPKSDSKYPTCVWTGEQERDFVRDYMGPAFHEQKVNAEIWLGTINDAKPEDFAIPVLSDPAAAKFITGVAYQWEGKEAIAKTHEFFPTMKLMQSESECGTGKNSFADAEHTFALMRTYFNGGASSYFYWNMVLPPGGVSTWGWKQNALITIDPTPPAHTITRHPEFYLMKLASHFIPPGSHLVTTTGNWGDKLAFQTPAGDTVLLVGNSSKSDLPLIIATGTNESLHLTLPSHSLNAFVLPEK